MRALIFQQSNTRRQIAWLWRNWVLQITVTEFFREPCLLRPFWFVPAKWPHINWERFWNTITANGRNLVMLCKYSKHDSSYTIISFYFSKRLCWCSPWLHYKIPTWTYLGDFAAYSRTYWIHWKNNLQTNLTKEPSC